MRRSSQSAPEYSLLLKKPPAFNKKILNVPSLGPVSIIAIIIALTFENCMVWLLGGCLCQQTSYKWNFWGVVGFKSSALTIYCLNS